jgi:hypothetical protein
MREKGEITQEEFERIKAELLAETPDEAAPPKSEAQQAVSAPESDTANIDSQTRWWLVGTGVLMAVGSFLPWARAGIFSVAGTEGDGILTLIGGVAVALVGVANRASIVTGIGTIVVAGLSFWVVANIFGNFGVLETDSIGSGLYLTGLASLFAIIAGFRVIGQARK